MPQDTTIFPDYNPEEEKDFSSEFAPLDNDAGSTEFPSLEKSGFIPGQRGRFSKVSKKPLAGFLYSISRTGFGEYWPLYIGPNRIGRSFECDIILPEATVSAMHAEIVIRRLKNPDRLEASISDARSSHGTLVNGESVPQTKPVTCKNGDIITIGESYRLYMIIVDAKALGLSVADNFIDAFTHSRMIDDQGEENIPVPPRFHLPAELQEKQDNESSQTESQSML